MKQIEVFNEEEKKIEKKMNINGPRPPEKGSVEGMAMGEPSGEEKKLKSPPMESQESKRRALSGDRPTGPLHLGHYVGSLQDRVKLMEKMPQLVLIADMQAMTDKMGVYQSVSEHTIEVLMDYLAVGLDPKQCTIFKQSAINELSVLSMIFLNLTHTGRLLQNPTVRREAQQKGFIEGYKGENGIELLKGSLPAGFFVYPVSQASDILLFDATDIPVGSDQLPMIEQANELAGSFNRLTETRTFGECKALLSEAPRLSGIYGKEKMSKSLNNAIYLKDDADTIKKKVFQMYTDPKKASVATPGNIEGHVVFEFLEVFDKDQKTVSDLKEAYKAGGLGDVVLKKRLTDLLNARFEPIRKRRRELLNQKGYLEDVLREGNERASLLASQKLIQIKKALNL